MELMADRGRAVEWASMRAQVLVFPSRLHLMAVLPLGGYPAVPLTCFGPSV